MPAMERKAQLVNIAIPLFGRVGFNGTTTKAIAKAAGVSEATIFRHFPSKEALYREALQQTTRVGVGAEGFVAQLQSYADQQNDDELLRTFFRAILNGYQHNRNLHRMLLYAWLDQGKVANRRLQKTVPAHPLFNFLVGYVKDRQTEGVFHSGNPRLLVEVLIGLPVHYANRTKLYALDTEFTDEAYVEGLVRLFLDGARVRPAVIPPALKITAT